MGLGGEGDHTPLGLPDHSTFPYTLRVSPSWLSPRIPYLQGLCVPLYTQSVEISAIRAFMCLGQVSFIWMYNESLGVVV